jgi:RHS repeat-associated protein
MNERERLAINDKVMMGSIIKLTDADGTAVFEASYDAWGNQTIINGTFEFHRGYTGHEHLPEFGLINMNGRMYDPVLGRFLSPDPFVQMPDFSQNFNRYAYCLNNPFKYTDPNGEIVWFVPVIIGAVIGAYSGGVIANDGQYNPAKWDYSSGKTWGYMLGGAVIGAGSAWAGGSVAVCIGQNMAFAGAGTVAGAVGGAVGGVISGGGFAALAGGNVFDGMWKGALSGLLGGAVGSYIGGGWGAFAGGATAGGVGSALNGGDLDDILGSALLGGVVSWGSYQIQQAIGYWNYKKTGGSWSYKQYSEISLASQRSFARGKEYGGWILDNGDVEMWPIGGKDYIDSTPMPDNAIAEFHTHPNWGGITKEMHSKLDMKYAAAPSYVVGRQHVWYYNPLIGGRPFPFYNSLKFNVYPYNLHWIGHYHRKRK